ncbi:MAG: polysaccharide deacetylase [Lachnospiraceae bacterium]|nr:polysaccharide deacetylase [Lachnospiraceae bacterium]
MANEYRESDPGQQERYRRTVSQAERAKRRRRRRRLQILKLVLLVLAVLVVVGGVTFLVVKLVRHKNDDKRETIPVITTTSPEQMTEAPTTTAAPAEEGKHTEVYNTAARMAAMYDYDGAIAYIQAGVPDYESDAGLLALVQNCSAKKLQLVKWKDNTQITHIFFHSLIEDKQIAFSSSKSSEYNQVMTTIPEFNRIIQTMYEGGYVLVHLSDICKMETLPDGRQQMTMQAIYLPEGKKPFVLSVDDLSYYEYMKETGGFANRLVVTDKGNVVCEMDITEEDGSVSHVRGNFDVVPLLDAFVEEHPDFSYHGAKGTIALTGYNGIFGYRTSEISYGSKDPNKVDLTIYERWPSTYEYYNEHIEEDRVTAKAVADALRATGWKFASHTWGHMNMSNERDGGDGNPTERFYRDTQWWDTEVRPLLGEVDIIIFAFGADIGSWRGYTDENKAFLHLKERGFNYFCNVDSSQHAWVQYSATAGGSGYLRQGRRNLDGQLLYKAILYPEKEILSDLFDPLEIIDRDRPLPVEGVTVPEGVDGTTLPEAGD